MTMRRVDIMDSGEGEDRAGDGGAGQEKPEWLRRRLAWFQDRKFGLFLHWGIYCQWDCCESWPLVEEDTWARPDTLRCWNERRRDFERFCADYRALNRTFDPTDFDAAVWAAAAQGAHTPTTTRAPSRSCGSASCGTRTGRSRS